MLAVTLGGLSLTPSAYAAGYGCSGTLIDTYRVVAYPGGDLYGRYYLYYDSSTGVNCGVTVATSTGGYGVPKPMIAEIDVCGTSTAGNSCNPIVTADDDRGNYSNYAGPVSVKAAGRCIAIFGAITWNGKTGFAETRATHCG